MATSSAHTTPTVGILSIGDMGMGVARLLRHHDHTVYTVAQGRRQVPSDLRPDDIELFAERLPSSQHTLDRIESSQITTLESDEQLVAEADIILSIVPPRDAVATARRALEACRSQTAIKRRSERRGTAAVSQAPSLTYIDLNAISPKTARSIAAMFATPMSPASPRKLSISRTFSFSPRRESEPELDPISVDFLDGGIIGGPPSLKQDNQTWKKPSVVISGPKHAELLTPAFIDLLNMRILGPKIGTASALKSCFASLTKGMTALSILSFTTAHTCGVLKELQAHLQEFSPQLLAAAQGGLVSMPPKAYRWVEEMRQINETFAEEGGFTNAVLSSNAPGNGNGNEHDHQHKSPNSVVIATSNGKHVSGVFEGIAEVYNLVANDTILGEERVERRKRGTNPEDVAECMRDGIARKKRKLAGEESELEAAWRGSWGA
ncbi:uncharacterized protein Z520_05730 [Fonsecaea multimorphosa CBS 102226]|uniref:Phosphogluconate dehydrogenase NAD-binding putative C-terminal domain-containing protein n=1 Tax=Fonsecaea multimorphosa CBS 102226 TaxID=1442371 RepID=A0A0D2K5L4_9EURO|nr:uncharacterized protein Z520_05730 [Fonsecaea multimorphosa CBS 102226]KIX98429.1 hypothetical protein Z520_05730 [Fonsecaea multimorphosa CBS 102226]OAL24622.1 hypothetical protein AYO22_05411 [Fonsecaea multimorphosa]